MTVIHCQPSTSGNHYCVTTIPDVAKPYDIRKSIVAAQLAHRIIPKWCNRHQVEMVGLFVGNPCVSR